MCGRKKPAFEKAAQLIPILLFDLTHLIVQLPMAKCDKLFFVGIVKKWYNSGKCMNLDTDCRAYAGMR